MRTTIISSPAPVLATTTVWTAESRERSRSQREPQLDMQRARWCRIAPCSAGDHDSNPTLYERQSVPQPPTSHPNLRRLLRPSPLRCEHCSGANTCLNRARLLLPHAPPLCSLSALPEGCVVPVAKGCPRMLRAGQSPDHVLTPPHYALAPPKTRMHRRRRGRSQDSTPPCPTTPNLPSGSLRRTLRLRCAASTRSGAQAGGATSHVLS
jgi:hypothetical protein